MGTKGAALEVEDADLAVRTSVARLPVAGVMGVERIVGPPKPRSPGARSSKTTSAAGVFWGVFAFSKPPNPTRRSDEATPFQTCVAWRIWPITDEKLSLAAYEVGPASETKNQTVLLGRAVRSNLAGALPVLR